MKKLNKALVLFCVTVITALQAAAQGGGNESAIGETMRSNGRIYVVVAVMLTILAGLVLYLIRLDRRVSKLEKE